MGKQVFRNRKFEDLSAAEQDYVLRMAPDREELLLIRMAKAQGINIKGLLICAIANSLQVATRRELT